MCDDPAAQDTYKGTLTMAFIDPIIAKACSDPRLIALPEPEDDRTLKAADVIEERGIARTVLIGDTDTVHHKCRELGIAREFNIVDPKKAEWLEDFIHTYHEMRKIRGLTEQQAEEMMKTAIPHAVMMLHQGHAEGLVAGACHSTGDTLRPALHILKTALGCSQVSSFFFMTLGETTYLFADCALVPDPNAEQLAEIALSTAQSALSFGIEPNVALLSYSTKGSAKGPLVTKVQEATRLAQERTEDFFGTGTNVVFDGDLQSDAALVQAVGDSKAPGSPVAGKARVLVFPDLNSGNIAYKLVQRLAGASAYGPILQGMRLPVNDLSRGCSADDIVGVTAVTVLQCQMQSTSK